MDELRARTLVETLCKGIDPRTGEGLREEDCCADEQVQLALRIVLERCTIRPYVYDFKKKRKSRAPIELDAQTKPWENPDVRYANGWMQPREQELFEEYRDGVPLRDMAKSRGITRKELKEMLHKMKLR